MCQIDAFFVLQNLLSLSMHNNLKYLCRIIQATVFLIFSFFIVHSVILSMESVLERYIKHSEGVDHTSADESNNSSNVRTNSYVNMITKFSLFRLQQSNSLVIFGIVHLIEHRGLCSEAEIIAKVCYNFTSSIYFII